MPEGQIHAEKPPKQEVEDPAARADQEQAVAEGIARTGAAGEKLKGELDDLLDDIEDVLEENAETFVKDYVQKGGE